jgi:hypothetical protein
VLLCVIQKQGDDSLRLPQRAQVVVWTAEDGAYAADVVLVCQLSDGRDVAIVQAYDFVHLRAQPKDASQPRRFREGKRHLSVPSCPYVWLTNSFALVDASAIIGPAVLLPDLAFESGESVMRKAAGEAELLESTKRPSFFWLVHVTPQVQYLIK